MRLWAPHFAVAVLLGLAGCDQPRSSQAGQVTFQQRVMPRLNPTKYEFDASIVDVKNAIKRTFGKWEDQELKLRKGRVWRGPGDAESKRYLTMALQLPPGSLFFKGDADALVKDLLTRPGNENDAYFYGTDSPVGESPVYFRDSQPLIYYADFHLHLTALGPKRTRVEVFTYDSNVAVGAEKSLTIHRYGPSLIVANVDPTTVEEYQILLRIGEQLGAKEMSPLITPGTNSPIRQITKPRRS